MIYHFESLSNHHFVQLGEKENIEFVGNEFVTDDENVAKKIRALSSFGGFIKEVDGEIAQEKKRKYKVISGSKGTDN